MLRQGVRFLVGLGCVAVLGWMTLAIYFSPLEPPWARAALGALVPVGAVVALVLVRPLRRVLAGVLAAFVVVLGAFLTVPASSERDWQPDVATLPFADIRGDRVLVHNVRNAEYRTETDYTVRLEDRELDLSRLRSLDVFLIYSSCTARSRACSAGRRCTTVSSAHIDGVESELVVQPSSHSTQANPRTIEEVRRILRRHVGLTGS